MADVISRQLLLSEDDLRGLLRNMQSEFGWSDPLPDFAEMKAWESRTSILYMVHGSGFEPAVIKVGKDWPVEKAIEVYEDLSGLESLFGDSSEVSLRLPRVLGWNSSPPSVGFAFVEGEDLSQRLSRREGYLSAEVERAMAQAGAALGKFHTAYSINPGDGEVEVNYDVIRSRLEAMAKKVLLGASFVDVDLTGLVSRRYGDFAPYNIRLGADGHLYLLDQPSAASYAPIHRDTAYFMYRVERRLGRYEPGLEEEQREVQDRLERVFMDAYAGTGPAPLDRVEDRLLFAVYLSHKHLRTARKRFRQRRFKEVPGYMRMSLQWRHKAQALARDISDSESVSPAAR